MGVLSDFIVAPASDAKRILDERTPQSAFHRVDVKGVMNHHLVALTRIVFPHDDGKLADALHHPINDTGDDEQWLFQFPRGLTQRLARLEEHHRAAVTHRWTKQLRDDGDADIAEHAGQLLDILCELAQRAVKDGHALFLWVCL